MNNSRFYRISTIACAIFTLGAFAIAVAYFIAGAAGYPGWGIGFVWLFNTAVFAWCTASARQAYQSNKQFEKVRAQTDREIAAFKEKHGL